MSYKPVDRQILITTEAPSTNPPNGIVYQWVDNDGFLHQLDSNGNNQRYVNLEELNQKVATSDIVDNLTSTDTDKPLSANQGKNLQDNKEDADSTILKEGDVEDNLNSTSTNKPLSANQGKNLQDNKADTSSLGSMAGQDADDVDITGGGIDGTPIGGNNAGVGVFSQLTTTSRFINVSSDRVGGSDGGDDTWKIIAPWDDSGTVNGCASMLFLVTNNTTGSEGKMGLWMGRVHQNNEGISTIAINKGDWFSENNFQARINEGNLEFKIYDSGTGVNTNVRVTVINGHPNLRL